LGATRQQQQHDHRGFALWDNTTGNNNTALGASALFNNMTGSNNIALGPTAGTGVSTASNVICIGIPGANVSDSFYVANVFETSIDPRQPSGAY
jgi:hypothetical protein